jgi:hypothetical protein
MLALLGDIPGVLQLLLIVVPPVGAGNAASIRRKGWEA